MNWWKELIVAGMTFPINMILLLIENISSKISNVLTINVLQTHWLQGGDEYQQHYQAKHPSKPTIATSTVPNRQIHCSILFSMQFYFTYIKWTHTITTVVVVGAVLLGSDTFILRVYMPIIPAPTLLK